MLKSDASMLGLVMVCAGCTRACSKMRQRSSRQVNLKTQPLCIGSRPTRKEDEVRFDYRPLFRKWDTPDTSERWKSSLGRRLDELPWYDTPKPTARGSGTILLVTGNCMKPIRWYPVDSKLLVLFAKRLDRDLRVKQYLFKTPVIFEAKRVTSVHRRHTDRFQASFISYWATYTCMCTDSERNNFFGIKMLRWKIVKESQAVFNSLCQYLCHWL